MERERHRKQERGRTLLIMNQLARVLLLIFATLGLPCPERFAAKDDIEELLKGKKVFSGVPTEAD